MSESGEYILRVCCDRKPPCEKGWIGQDDTRMPLRATFTALTRMDALAIARDAGWMLQHKGKVLCPDHATEKRDLRRDPK